MCRVPLLFRAVSGLELADIALTGTFRSSANSLGGKWFAETAAAAHRWGELLYSDPKDVSHVVQVDVSNAVADLMFRLSNLDQIGPARYAEADVLTLLNQQHHGIAEVPLTKMGGP
jgi:hypothetical protein